MTNSSLELYDGGRFEIMQRSASALQASGYFSDAQTKAQAIVKVMAGAELGISPFAAMTGIHIIKGKPSLGATLIAGLIKNDPRYDYRVKVMSDKECSIEFFEEGQSLGVSTFTAADAQRAGTQNMNKYPKNMLFARAMSNGHKWYCPGVGGGMPIYSPNEIGDERRDEMSGEVIDGDTGEIIDDANDVFFEEPTPAPRKKATPAPKNEVSTARTAEETAAALNEVSSKNGNPASEKQLVAMRSSLSNVADNDKDVAKSIMAYVFSMESSKEATAGEASAFIEWVGATADNGYTPSATAMQEAQRIHTAQLKASGQQELI